MTRRFRQPHVSGNDSAVHFFTEVFNELRGNLSTQIVASIEHGAEQLLRTMFDARNNLSTQVSAQLVKHFGEKVYRTIIPRNVRLAEAPSHGLPALLYDRNSSGALASAPLELRSYNSAGNP